MLTYGVQRMPEKRIRLTKTAVAALAGTPGKQVIVWDAAVRGFGVLISAGGTKTYVMQRRVGGKSRRVSIGRCDDWSTERARKEAERLAGEFGAGKDPVAERKRSAARAMTLGDALEAYVRAPVKKGGGKGEMKKPRTVADIRKVTKRAFSDWFDRPAAEITGAMVRARHAEISQTSTAQADLAARYLRACLNHVAADTDDDEPLLAANPVTRLNRANAWGPMRRATGHIPEDRIGDWMQAVETGLVGLKHEGEVRDCMLFLVLTGARLGEVLGDSAVGYPPLRWRDVDLAAGAVTFTATKNRRVHVLPLGRVLLARLKERHAAIGGAFVFGDAAGSVPMDLRGAVARIEKATGIRATAHDLRRTFASMATAAGVSAIVVKALLNHLSGGDVTSGYVQVTPADLRTAMQAVEDKMLANAP